MSVGAVVNRDVIPVPAGQGTSYTFNIDMLNQHDDTITNNMTFNVECTYVNFNSNLSYCLSIQNSCTVVAQATSPLVGFLPATFTHPERYGLSASTISMTFGISGWNLQVTISIPNCGSLTGHLAYRVFGSNGTP